MNLIISPENYNINYIYFNDSIKNTVIDNSNFIKIMFSNTDLYLNGFYVLITLENISVEKYYNKYKCVINEDNNINNKNIMQFMYKLEHELLHKYNNNKNKKLIITNQLKQNNIKLFIENKNIKETMYEKLQFCLKISGIWEKNDEIGLTYKFTII